MCRTMTRGWSQGVTRIRIDAESQVVGVEVVNRPEELDLLVPDGTRLERRRRLHRGQRLAGSESVSLSLSNSPEELCNRRVQGLGECVHR